MVIYTISAVSKLYCVSLNNLFTSELTLFFLDGGWFGRVEESGPVTLRGITSPNITVAVFVCTRTHKYL